MASTPFPPLRVALMGYRAPTADEIRTLAAMLARVGYPVQVSTSQEAEARIVLIADGDATGDDGAYHVSPLAMGHLTARLAGAGEGVRRDAHQRAIYNEEMVVDEPNFDQIARGIGRFLLEAAGRTFDAPREFTACVTFDIDSAGMFRGANPWHFAKLIPRGNLGAYGRFVVAGLATTVRLSVDPHLRLRPLLRALVKRGVPATFFVQTHREHRLDNYDLRTSPAIKEAMREAIRDGHQVGLHSSYATRDRGVEFWRAQWERLRAELGDAVSPVHRAHYLRVPDDLTTYAPPMEGRPLIDSSLMYSEREGFRRGTCHPFRLGEEQVEMPPCLMDSTLRWHRGFAPEEARQTAARLMRQVQSVGGVFTMVWHPHNMDEIIWEGWNEVFFGLIGEAKRLGARFQTLADAAMSLQSEADRLERELAGMTR